MMNRRIVWFSVVVAFWAIVVVVLLPSLRAGEFSFSISALITVAVVAVLAGTLLSIGTRRG